MPIIYKLLLLLISIHLISNCYAAPVKKFPFVTQQLKLTADLQQPSAVAIAENGHIYVLDGTKNRVVVFDNTGKLLFSFGQQGNNHLNIPMDISISANNVVIADTGSKQLAIYNLQGQFIKNIDVAGNSTNNIKQAVPVSVFIQSNIIFWADRPNHRICKTKLNTGKLITCFSGQGETDGLFPFNFSF